MRKRFVTKRTILLSLLLLSTTQPGGYPAQIGHRARGAMAYMPSIAAWSVVAAYNLASYSTAVNIHGD